MALHGVWRKETHRANFGRTRRVGRRGVPGGTGRGAAPDRVPARAGPRGHLQGQGLPRRRRRRSCRCRPRTSPARSRTAPSPTLPGVGASSAKVIAQAVRGRGARAARRAGARARRSADRRGSRAARRAARRPALALGLVRRRLADRGDGVHRDRARPRLPRAHRPLAAAHRRPRAERRAADPPARRRRRGQRPPGRRRLHAAQGDRGRHPRRRLARPGRRPAGPARRPGRQRALEAEDGRPGDDEADDRRGPQPADQRPRPLHRPDGDGQPGHPAESQFDAKAVFEACVEHDVAVEINSRPERRDPPTKLLELARDLGCLFSIDSDAHAPGQLDFQVYGCERAEEAGIDADRIVNTWPRERLLAWANG